MNALLLMKVIVVVPGLLGSVGIGLVLSPELWEQYLYQDRNGLAAATRKFLVFVLSLSLMLCALSPWFKPLATPWLAWLAIAFHLLGSVLDVVTRRPRTWCWRCMVTGTTVQAGVAVALTYLASVHASMGKEQALGHDGSFLVGLTPALADTGNSMAAELQAIQTHLWVLTGLLLLLLLATFYCNYARLKERSPVSPPAHMQNLWEREHFSELLGYTSSYLKDRPNASEVLMYRAMVLLRYKEYDEALRVTEKLGRSSPLYRTFASSMLEATNSMKAADETSAADGVTAPEVQP